MQASKMLSRVCPTLVVVLGATGAGKSKLALDIATKLNSEIISADSMQVYKGLDIITNKVSPEELGACPHHVIDYVNPLSRYTVVDFRDKAVPIIDNLLLNDKVPIIVGGTNYYIEALLWKVLLDPVKCSTDDLLIDRRGENKRIRIRKRSLPDNDLAPNAKHLQMDLSIEKNETVESCKVAADKDYIEQRPLNLCRQAVEQKAVEVETTATTKTLKTSTVATTDTLTTSNTLLSTSTVSTCVQALTDVSEAGPTGGQVQCSTLEYVASPNPGVSNTGVNYFNNDIDIDVQKLSSEELHAILKDVDPAMANKLHPKNRRKIIRSLQVHEQHNIPHSELLASQQAAEGGGPLGGPLRYSNVCVFWVQSDQAVLDERLDKRVDGMLERGLLRELSDFHVEYNQQRLKGNLLKGELYSQGIFQSIGFKEFHDYLILSEEERETEVGVNLKEQGIEKLMQVTRRYARKQLRWINNRFLQRPGPNVPAVYGLDASNPTHWNEMVLEPAMGILNDLIQGRVPSATPLASKERSKGESDVTFVCDLCSDRIIVGHQQWQAHLKSRGHLKRARKLRKKQLMDKYYPRTNVEGSL